MTMHDHISKFQSIEQVRNLTNDNQIFNIYVKRRVLFDEMTTLFREMCHYSVYYSQDIFLQKIVNKLIFSCQKFKLQIMF